MRVLVIDDNPDHRELIIAKIRKVYPDAEFVEVIRQSMLDEVLQRGDPLDAVLTDYRLQWSDGLKVLAQVRAQYPHVPVIMVTDTGSEEVAAAGMKGGLADYVLKGHLHRLPLAFKESLEKSPPARAITKRRWSGCGIPKSATGSFRSCRPTTRTPTESPPMARSRWSGSPRRSRASPGTKRTSWRAGVLLPRGSSGGPRADRARPRGTAGRDIPTRPRSASSPRTARCAG